MTIRIFLSIVLITLLSTTNLLSQVTVTIKTEGDSIVCSNNSIEIISSISPEGVYQYQWMLDDSEIVGANSKDYTANVTGKYSLALRDLDNNTYSSNSQEILISALPPLPQVTFQGSAIICENVTVTLETDAYENLSFQWFSVDSNTTLAYSHRFETNKGGAYYVEATDTISHCSSNSDVVYVSELPSIQDDSVIVQIDSMLYLSSPSMSYSVNNKKHIADIRENLKIVDNDLGPAGITNQKLLVRYGSILNISDSRNTVVVEKGGTLNGFGAGAYNVAYVKRGGIYNDTHRNTSSDTIYYEDGAIIDSQTKNILIPCENIGVIYPELLFLSVNNYTYKWSTGDTTPMIDVSNYVDSILFVEVSNGYITCTDSVFISSDTSVIDSNLSALLEEKLSDHLRVYPNPARSKINICLPSFYSDNAECYVRIYNISGKALYNSKIDAEIFEVNLALFAETGIYVLHVLNNKNNILDTKTFIVK